MQGPYCGLLAHALLLIAMGTIVPIPQPFRVGPRLGEAGVGPRQAIEFQRFRLRITGVFRA